MRSSRVLVFDCGASRVAAGVFSSPVPGRLRLEEFAFEPLPHEAGRDERWAEHTVQALRTLRQVVRANASVVLGLPGHLTLTKFVRTPRVDPSQRDKIIRFEAQQNIPYSLAEVVWDSLLVAEEAADMEVVFSAAKLDVVEELCGGAELAGFPPRALQPSFVATLESMRFSKPARAAGGPAIVANIGSRSTTLVFVEDGRFFSRTLSLAGGGITQALSEETGMDFAQAEAFKLAAFAGRGEDASAVLPRAVESFAGRLAQEITRSALNYRRHAGADRPACLLLTGGASQTPGLPALLAERLKLPVEPFHPLAAVEIVPAAEVRAHAASLADLVGLASAHFSAQAPVLDLLPPRLQRREMFRRRERWLVAAAAFAVAALVPPLVYLQQSTRAVQRRAAALEAQLVPLRELDARNRANLERLEQTKREIELLDGVYSSRATWLQLCIDLQERLVRVEDVWLDRLQLVQQDPGAAEPATTNAQAGSDAAAAARTFKIALSGRLLDTANPLSKVSDDSYRRVKTLLASLTGSRFVAGVENERFDNAQPGILRFDFVLVVNPRKEAPAPPS